MMNHKDEYPQMTLWLKQKEKVLQHDIFIKWQWAGSSAPPLKAPEVVHHTHIKMTWHPSVKAVPLNRLISDYGAIDF